MRCLEGYSGKYSEGVIDMSWYTNFYITYQTSDGKIYPYGPFDYKGDYKCVHYTSRSFTTDLKEWFEPITRDQLSQELIDVIFNIEIPEDYELLPYMGICPLDALPKGDFIRKGYFLIEDIENYLKDEDREDLFYDYLEPTSYALKMENELKFGKPTEKIDDWGNEYIPKSCADYAYFCFPDYSTKEWEVFCIKRIVYAIYDEYLNNIPEDARIVVFKTEG